MEQPITSSWRKGNRYYVVGVVQDLFGNWMVQRKWGSIQTNRGNTITLDAENYEHALKLVNDVEKRRKTRGYTTNT